LALYGCIVSLLQINGKIIMCSDKSYFKLMHHGPIVEVLNNVYSIQGTMKLFGLFQYSRNMTVLKDGGSIVLINPIRLDQKTELEILKVGKISHILKIGSLHSVDIPYYMDKFSPKLWSLKNDKSLPDFPADHFLSHNLTLPFLDLKVHVFEGSKVPESLIYSPDNGGVFFSCDSLVNMSSEDSHANTLVRVLSKLLPKPTLIGPNWVKFAKPTKSSFVNILTYDFENLVFAHGNPILGSAKIQLENYFSTYKKFAN
jgi:hypothetical protein